MNTRMIYFLAFLFFLMPQTVHPQQKGLHESLTMQKAYQNGTRSRDGMVPKGYWQNRVDYIIEAELVPAASHVKGQVTAAYQNNSPDTLTQLVVRLYADMYRKGNSRDFRLDPRDLHDGMTIRNVMIDGMPVPTEGQNLPVRRQGTNLFIRLSQRLAPGGTMEFKTDFVSPIPEHSRIRLGRYESSSFFVAYWFPQISVYDDLDGWDVFDFVGTQETYNEFGSYDVSLTVPNDYLVWATGILQNPTQVLAPQILERYSKAQTSNEIIKIVTEEDYRNGPVTGVVNTWKYSAVNVPDFAFAVSDHYLWDGSAVEVDSVSGRSAFVSAAYNRKSNDFYGVAQIARDAIDYFSRTMPAVPYPYPTMTVYNGEGGMEFPMMVNDGSTSTRPSTVGLTSHEIAHTYFPFYMGINERKYAWMDEGWAVMLPFEFQSTYGAPSTPIENNVRGFEAFSGRELEMPMMTPSVLLRNTSYRVASYAKPGLAYEYLRDMLGTERFLKALQSFMAEWNGKHPVPHDFFYHFNTTLKEDLSWYWKPWFFESAYSDLTLQNVRVSRNEAKLVIANKGGLPVPFSCVIRYVDGSEQQHSFNASVWKGNARAATLTVRLDAKKKLREIEVGGPRTPDVDRSNNLHRLHP